MPKGQPALVSQPWPHKGWEYQELVVEYGGSWSEALNGEGRDGWMLVSVIHDEDPKAEDRQVRLLMMRPLDKDWRPAGERVVRVVKQRTAKKQKAEAAPEVVDETEDE